MDDWVLESKMIELESKMIDYYQRSKTRLFIRSELLLMEKDDGFLEPEMFRSIHQTSRYRSLNLLALGAPEHITTIKKRRLPSSKAVAIQERLQTLIAGARQSWTYAIFWKAFNVNAEVKKITDDVPRILDWGTGYYEGEEDKLNGTQSSKTEQDHRKRSLRYPYHPEEDMTDLERFFSTSKAEIFFPGNGLPGRALCTSTAIWASGAQKLAGFYCKHAYGARECGIQTLVCIPLADGVVELGSSALISSYSEFDLLDRVMQLFNFKNNICIQICTNSAGSSLIPSPIQRGYESESSVGNCPMFQQSDSSSKESAGSSLVPSPIQPGYESESSVGSFPMFPQGDSFSVDSAGSSSIPSPIQPGYKSESSVGSCPFFQQDDSSSEREEETQSNSDGSSDSRYLEVFTQILRGINYCNIENSG